MGQVAIVSVLAARGLPDAVAGYQSFLAAGWVPAVVESLMECFQLEVRCLIVLVWHHRLRPAPALAHHFEISAHQCVSKVLMFVALSWRSSLR